MDFDLSNDHQKLKTSTAEFCRSEIAPHAMILDESPKDKASGMIKENLVNLGKSGFLGLALEDDPIGLCVAGEEVAKACPATFLAAMSSAVAFGRALKLAGTPAQKEKMLPGISSGAILGGLAYTEADAGSDLSAMKTTAAKKGDNWILNGAKAFVTNAPIADALLVLAWTDQAAGLDKGTSFFIVDKGSKGLTIGAPLETIGLRGALLSEVVLDDCEVAANGLLGAVGTGIKQLNDIMEFIKISLSAMSVGIGMACMEQSTLHAKSRKAFGKPIGLFEGVGAKMAIMFTYNDLGRELTYRAACAMEKKDPETPVLTSCAKLFTSEGVNEIADLAMQVHGGHGYIKGTAVERLYRDARFATIAYGTSEMQRAYIAKDSLDKYKPT